MNGNTSELKKDFQYIGILQFDKIENETSSISLAV